MPAALRLRARTLTAGAAARAAGAAGLGAAFALGAAFSFFAGCVTAGRDVVSGEHEVGGLVCVLRACSLDSTTDVDTPAKPLVRAFILLN